MLSVKVRETSGLGPSGPTPESFQCSGLQAHCYRCRHPPTVLPPGFGRSTTLKQCDAVATWVQIGNLEDHFSVGCIWHAVEIIIFNDVRHIDAIINHIQIFMRWVVTGHSGRRVGACGFIVGLIVS